MLGLTSPYMHELPEYLGYNIKKLKGYARFLEVVINRDGVSNGIIGLYFDGACNYYRELPPPDDTEGLESVYNHIRDLKSMNTNKVFILFNNIKKYLKNGKRNSHSW